MLFLRNIYITFVVLLIVPVCWASQKIEREIGPFNLSATSITESQLVTQFGEGYVRINKVDDKILNKSRIYYSPNDNMWVEVRFSHVLDKNLKRVVETVIITKNKLCNKKFIPKKTFGSLVTSRGIKLGDSIEKVIRTYGKPSIFIEIGKDKLFSVLIEDLNIQKGCVLRYLADKPDDLLFAEFFFKEGRLHSLLISESE